MSDVSATAVKSLRDRTQLPLMDCKRALIDAGGDQEQAIRLLREQGKKTMAKRTDRSTDAGRIAIHVSLDPGVGTMIELQCESTPVANHEEFVALARDLARQLAMGPGAASAEELWNQPSPSHDGKTLHEQHDELANRIREVFRLERIVRIDGACGGYVHHTGVDAAILEVFGGTATVAKDLSLHIVASKPKVVCREELDSEEIEKEREILTSQARREGKPEKIIQKMVEGRLRNFYAEQVLIEQPFVKDEKQTVGEFAASKAVKPLRFVRWQLGKHDQ